MFDISTLALKDTTEYVLRHPTTGEELGAEDARVVFELYGSSSREYRDALQAFQTRIMRERARSKDQQVSPAFMRRESLELLVAVTAEVRNLTLEGKEITAGESVRALYTNPKYEWVRQQIDEALGNTANFLVS